MQLANQRKYSRTHLESDNRLYNCLRTACVFLALKDFLDETEQINYLRLVLRGSMFLVY